MAYEGRLIWRYAMHASALYGRQHVRFIELTAPRRDPRDARTADLEQAEAVVELENGARKRVPFRISTTSRVRHSSCGHDGGGPIQNETEQRLWRAAGRSPEICIATGSGDPPVMQWEADWTCETIKEANDLAVTLRAQVGEVVFLNHSAPKRRA